MRKILHILVKPDDLSQTILAEELKVPNCQHKTFIPEKDGDYNQLLEEIFASESVHVWS